MRIAARRPAPPLVALLVGAALAIAPRTLPAQERWQLTLADGSYEYDLRPVELRNDSLVIEQAGGTRALPLVDVHELREVRPVIRPAVPGRGTVAELTGASDRVFVLGYLPVADRRRVVREILESVKGSSAGHAAGASMRRSGGTPTEWSGP